MKKKIQFPSINEIWNDIQTLISGYLIKQSYSKLNKDRIKEFYLNKSINTKEFDENEYIKIGQINT